MCLSACEFRCLGLQKAALDSLELEESGAVPVSNCRATPAPLGKDIIFIMSQLCVNVCVCACASRDHVPSRKKDLDRSSDLSLVNLLS